MSSFYDELINNAVIFELGIFWIRYKNFVNYYETNLKKKHEWKENESNCDLIFESIYSKTTFTGWLFSVKEATVFNCKQFFIILQFNLNANFMSQLENYLLNYNYLAELAINQERGDELARAKKLSQWTKSHCV